MNYLGDNMMDVKRKNRCAALRVLHEQGAMSRKHLAETIKLTPAAITKIVAELIEDGLVSEGKAVSAGGVGRREVLIEPNYAGRCALGVLINLRMACISAIRLDGTVIFSESMELEERASAEQTVCNLSKRILELVAENEDKTGTVIGLGVAIRGITSENERSIHNSFRALDAKDYPIADRFERYTGYHTVLANNVRALFLAHNFLSRAPVVPTRCFIRCEYGIGASLSVNGTILHGSTGHCSEIGHIPFVEHGGKQCLCGKTGCLETVASPMAIIEDAEAVLSRDNTPILFRRFSEKGSITLDDIFYASSSGDTVIFSIVDRAVSAFASALKSVIYIVDPQEIILYGRMFENEYYLSLLIAKMHDGVDSEHSVRIFKSEYNLLLENKAAGLLAVDDFILNGGLI